MDGHAERRAEENGGVRVAVSGAGEVTVAHALDGDGLVHVLRLDGAGDELWSLELPGADARVDGLDVDASGRTLLGMYTFDDRAARALMLIGSDGDVKWTRGSDDIPIEITSDLAFGPCDTIVLAGTADSIDDTPGFWRQLWITKLTADGDPLWTEMIDGPLAQPEAEDSIHAIVIDEAGRVTAAGAVTTAIDPDNGDEEFPTHDRDLWLGRFGA